MVRGTEGIDEAIDDRVRVGFTVVVAAQPPADLSRQSAGGATADWPQWQGPDRTGLSKETGLLQQWPPSGPPAVWSISGLGAGYGSVAVKGDRIFVQALHAAERTSTVVEPEPRRRQGRLATVDWTRRLQRSRAGAARDADDRRRSRCTS